MARAARYDGLLPVKMSPTGSFEKVYPDDLIAMKAWIESHRVQSTSFNIILENDSSSGDGKEDIGTLREYEAAGATWWLESMWTVSNLDEVHTRILQGPPAI